MSVLVCVHVCVCLRVYLPERLKDILVLNIFYLHEIVKDFLVVNFINELAGCIFCIYIFIIHI